MPLALSFSTAYVIGGRARTVMEGQPRHHLHQPAGQAWRRGPRTHFKLVGEGEEGREHGAEAEEQGLGGRGSRSGARALVEGEL